MSVSRNVSIKWGPLCPIIIRYHFTEERSRSFSVPYEQLWTTSIIFKLLITLLRKNKTTFILVSLEGFRYNWYILHCNALFTYHFTVQRLDYCLGFNMNRNISVWYEDNKEWVLPNINFAMADILLVCK